MRFSLLAAVVIIAGLAPDRVSGQQSTSSATPGKSSSDQLRNNRAAWDRAREAADKERIRKEKERFDELQRKAAAAKSVESPPSPLTAPAPVAAQTQTPVPRKVKPIERRAGRAPSTQPRDERENNSLAELRKAADAYFRGDYAVAAELLAHSGERRDAKRAFYIDLFHAASLYSLYALHGQRDDSLVKAAAKYVVSCYKSNPRFVPDRRAFSPRFIDFYLRTASASGRA